jgi:hypothetical protein
LYDKNKLQDVTDGVGIVDGITATYNEKPTTFFTSSRFITFSTSSLMIFQRTYCPIVTDFKESKIWNTLYNFQKDAALAIINKLKKYNNCILADSGCIIPTFHTGTDFMEEIGKFPERLRTVSPHPT